MATVYITFEIAKDFEDWKEVFDDDQENLNENGIETLAVGYELDNPSKVRIAYRQNPWKRFKNLCKEITRP